MKLGGFSVTLGAVAALALLVVGASGTFAGPTPDSDGDGVKNLVDNCMAKFLTDRMIRVSRQITT